jgi:hypothetical protein
MTMTRRTWEIIIIVTAIAVDVLKLFKDKFNGGKKNDSTRSTKKK